MNKTGPRDDASLAAIRLEWWPRSNWNWWPPSSESAAGSRIDIKVAMDWTDFDADQQTTIITYCH
jgi:hypothetical protein